MIDRKGGLEVRGSSVRMISRYFTFIKETRNG